MKRHEALLWSPEMNSHNWVCPSQPHHFPLFRLSSTCTRCLNNAECHHRTTEHKYAYRWSYFIVCIICHPDGHDCQAPQDCGCWALLASAKHVTAEAAMEAPRTPCVV